MNRRSFQLLGYATLGLAGLVACTPPPVETPPALSVPETYRQAKQAEGHVRHVGAAKDATGEPIRCRDCHDVDTDGFDKPQDVTCKNCHEDREHVGHPLVDRASKAVTTSAQACLACHAFAGPPPASIAWSLSAEELDHPQGSWPFDSQVLRAPAAEWTCLECHDEPQGDAVAVKVHEGACFVCHDPHREPLTEPARCTLCHDIGLAHGARGATLAETCMKCHAPHHKSSDASVECARCHSDHRGDSKVTANAITSDHPSCGTCHEAHTFTKRDVVDCASCHDALPVLAQKKHAHPSCSSCHDPHEPAKGPVACQGACHQKLSAQHPPDEAHAASAQACTTCHPPHASYPQGVNARRCDECHEPAKFAHAKGEDGNPIACASCHGKHRFQLGTHDRRPCKECHADELAASMVPTKRGHRECEACHAGLPHTPAAEKKPCLTCHEEHTPAHPSHAKEACTACHEAHAGKIEKACSSCHDAQKLLGLHRVTEHMDCKDCHAPHGKQPDPRAACLSCHKDMAAHEPNAKRCNSCHLFVEGEGAPGRPKNPRP